MVNEQYESGYGLTVRAFAFDGDEVKYRSWEGRTLALAGSKGFLLALTKENTGKSLTVEEHNYGEVEVPGIGMTGRSGKSNGIKKQAGANLTMPA